MTISKIILASKSPRRALILELAEVTFEVVTSDSDESYPEGLLPAEVAMHIAKQKAVAVIKKLGADTKTYEWQYPIVAADTIVVLDASVIGKPVNAEDAINILRSLSGKMHSVITSVCILYKKQEVVFCDTTEVEFNNLSEEQIRYYVDRYQPLDKAGAYAIQEWIGIIGIKAIRGDYYNVMGLPVSRLMQELRTLDN